MNWGYLEFLGNYKTAISSLPSYFFFLLPKGYKDITSSNLFRKIFLNPVNGWQLDLKYYSHHHYILSVNLSLRQRLPTWCLVRHSSQQRDIDGWICHNPFIQGAQGQEFIEVLCLQQRALTISTMQTTESEKVLLNSSSLWWESDIFHYRNCEVHNISNIV